MIGLGAMAEAEIHSNPGAGTEPDRFNLPAAESVMSGEGLRAPRPQQAPRDAGLRATFFCTLVGAVLAMVYARVWATPPLPGGGGGTEWGFSWVLLLALVTVAGATLLERAPAGGILLMLISTSIGLAAGTVWLIPGVVLGAVWAARHSARARATLGMLCLLPGSTAVFYGLFAMVGYRSQLHLGWLPLSLDPPATFAQALWPMSLLPLALLGSWLLVIREPV